jgi:hypothetical protein
LLNPQTMAGKATLLSLACAFVADRRNIASKILNLPNVKAYFFGESHAEYSSH